jgi:hypothetical protein
LALPDFASSRPEGKLLGAAGADVVVCQGTARLCLAARRCDVQLYRKPETTLASCPVTTNTLDFLH